MPSFAYECSAVQVVTGEFEPDAGCPTGPTSPQPVDVKVGRIRPFAIDNTGRYLPDGPNPIGSVAYAEDFQETRDYGRIDSVFRSPEQTDLAYFWSDNPYVFWNRNLIALATSQQLRVLETARLFAMVHTAVSDAIIVGFDAKYRFTAWRPRTAIPRADTDPRFPFPGLRFPAPDYASKAVCPISRNARRPCSPPSIASARWIGSSTGSRLSRNDWW